MEFMRQADLNKTVILTKLRMVIWVGLMCIYATLIQRAVAYPGILAPD